MGSGGGYEELHATRPGLADVGPHSRLLQLRGWVRYCKASVPKGQMQLGGAVIKLVEAYCAKHGIEYEENF